MLDDLVNGENNSYISIIWDVHNYINNLEITHTILQHTRQNHTTYSTVLHGGSTEFGFVCISTPFPYTSDPVSSKEIYFCLVATKNPFPVVCLSTLIFLGPLKASCYMSF